MLGDSNMNCWALILTASLALLTGCKPESPSKTRLSVDEIVEGFTTPSKDLGDVQHVVDNALRSERSVIFLHMNWAMTEIYHRKYAEFMVAYHAKHPNDPLLFHFADCTPVSQDYAPLRAIPGWRQLIDDAGTAMIHGNGEVAWFEGGRVLHVQSIRDFKTPSELVKLTETLIPTNGQR